MQDADHLVHPTCTGAIKTDRVFVRSDLIWDHHWHDLEAPMRSLREFFNATGISINYLSTRYFNNSHSSRKETNMKIALRDYARNNRCWKGKVKTAFCKRLATELNGASSSIDVGLEFSVNDENRVHVKGLAYVEAIIDCHRCMKGVATAIKAEIDALVVRSEEVAKDLAQSDDVILVSEDPVPVSELIEDDLIMSIPWRVCVSGDQCDNLSGMPLRGSIQKKAEDTHSPFANLRDLLSSK